MTERMAGTDSERSLSNAAFTTQMTLTVSAGSSRMAEETQMEPNEGEDVREVDGAGDGSRRGPPSFV